MSTKNGNYDYLYNTSYAPPPYSYAHTKPDYDYSKYQSSWDNFRGNNSNSFYKNKWDGSVSASLTSSQTKPEPKFSESYTPQYQPAEYKNVKKLSNEFSSLRQTFDTRGTGRIRDMISKYDEGQSEVNQYKGKNFDKYDKNGSSFINQPKGKAQKYRNYELEDKLKKYSTGYDVTSSIDTSTNNVGLQLNKLKEDRRKRLEAKEKQDNKFTLTSSYSSVNLGSSVNYKPQLSAPIDYDKYDFSKKYHQSQKYDNFKKKKTLQIDSPYTPKYQKNIYKQYSSPSNKIQQYKSKEKETPKDSKYDYKSYQPSIPKFTPLSSDKKDNGKSSTPTTHISRKISESYQLVEVNNFILGKSLGEGKFGVVYQATHKPTGWLYAIKKIPKQMIKSHFMIDQFILELKLQTYLYHENILSLFTHFDDKTSIYIVLQYMEQGTLFAHLKKNKTLPEDEVAVKIRQIASAVKYLHENQIAHRDIKPENIVMSHGVCKLCDFGWATICDQRRKTYCGTFDYAPPEILQGVEYDFTVDLWCLGVLTYELLVGKAPFYHISRKQTMKKILNVEKTTLEYPDNISKNAISFIDSLIKKDPKQRLSSEMLLEHPFLKYANKYDLNKY